MLYCGLCELLPCALCEHLGIRLARRVFKNRDKQITTHSRNTKTSAFDVQEQVPSGFGGVQGAAGGPPGFGGGGPPGYPAGGRGPHMFGGPPGPPAHPPFGRSLPGPPPLESPSQGNLIDDILGKKSIKDRQQTEKCVPV